jgi:hypothetical protein
MLGSFFKTRSNRSFNYTPQYYDADNDRKLTENNFAKYRRSWEEAGRASRTKKNAGVSKRLVIIFVVLIFIALYILDFDLSIFTRGK